MASTPSRRYNRIFISAAQACPPWGIVKTKGDLAAVALLGIDIIDDQLRLHSGGDVDAALAAELRALPVAAPIVVLLHGYKFSPISAAADPPPAYLVANAAKDLLESHQLAAPFGIWPG